VIDDGSIPPDLKSAGISSWPEMIKPVVLDDGFGWEFPAATYPFIVDRLRGCNVRVDPPPAWVLLLAGKFFRRYAGNGVLDGLPEASRRALEGDKSPASCPEPLKQHLHELTLPTREAAKAGSKDDAADVVESSMAPDSDIEAHLLDSSAGSLSPAAPSPLSAQSLQNLLKAELVSLARERGLKVSGTKEELVGRIVASMPSDAEEAALSKGALVTEVVPISSSPLEDEARTYEEVEDEEEEEATRASPLHLLDYQLHGIRRGIERHGRLLLGDEMGLGKTVLQRLHSKTQHVLS